MLKKALSNLFYFFPGEIYTMYNVQCTYVIYRMDGYLQIYDSRSCFYIIFTAGNMFIIAMQYQTYITDDNITNAQFV